MNEQTFSPKVSYPTNMNESLEQPLQRIADEIVRVLKEPRVFRWSTWDSWAGRQVHHERGMSEQEAVIAVLTQHSFPSTERDALQRQLAAEREAREKAEAQYGTFMSMLGIVLHELEHCQTEDHLTVAAQIRLRCSTEPPALLKEVDGLRQQVRMDTETIERIRAAGEAAEANLALAVDALVRYGEHDLNCPVYRDTIGDCDCGWTDTLPKLTAAGKGREP